MEEMKMKEDYKELIQEWFADCCSNVERAKLYADLLMEINLQLEVCIQEPQE
jgi:hypothetical protein